MAIRQTGPNLQQHMAHLKAALYERMAAEQLEVVEELVQQCFDLQRQPDGTPWPERADGSGRPLLLTIGETLKFYSDHTGSSLGTVYVDCPTKPHNLFQRLGTVVNGETRIPARPWAPEPGEPMPAAWQMKIDARLRSVFRKAWQAARGR